MRRKKKKRGKKGKAETYRIKVLKVSPEFFVGYLKAGRIPAMVLMTERLPEDAEVVGCTYDRAEELIILVLGSEEYPEVEAGGEAIEEVERPVWGVVKEV